MVLFNATDSVRVGHFTEMAQKCVRSCLAPGDGGNEDQVRVAPVSCSDGKKDPQHPLPFPLLHARPSTCGRLMRFCSPSTVLIFHPILEHLT